MRQMPFRGALAGMVAAMAACGGGSVSQGTDGGPTESDAGVPGDAASEPSLTDDLAGGWRFEAGDPAATLVTCGVVIGFGDFEITCPDQAGPININSTCQQIRNDIRISGELTGGQPAVLNGGVDLVEEYAGDGCAEAGYTSGVPMVTKGLAWLWAERLEVGGGGGFWSAVDGTWTFELTDAADPTGFLACTVHLAGGAFIIDCPGTEPLEPVPGCFELTGGSLTGALAADAMSGEIFDVITREGTACGPAGLPLHEEGARIPISATRL